MAHTPRFLKTLPSLLTSKLLGHSRTLHRDRLIAGGDRDLGSPKAQLRRPTIAFGPQGKLVVLYEGTDQGKLGYVVGRLDQHGRIQGQERLLDMRLDLAG
jgi:hypothetical protein